VSNVEYWILERTNGAAQGTVHLSYNDTRSGGAGLPADLLVCRWNSGTPIWENKGNGGTSAAGGFTYVQSTAGSFTAFSPVTLGSTTRFNVLPVAWLDFTVKKVGTTAELSWKTQEDGKNQGFEIEKSIDGQNFRTIGTQAPQTKAGLGSYLFTYKSIHEVAARVLYYRIKQVDTDGVVTYSKVQTVLNDSPALFMANVFPNPFDNVFTVEIVSEEELTFAASLVDMLGKNVKELTLPCKKGINTFTVPAHELPQGVYLLRLQTNESQISYKVVKE
ncbi:MAG: T9SS type A sorting domain-containing protein, partial [Thermoflexibacteraceae bacterium]